MMELWSQVVGGVRLRQRRAEQESPGWSQGGEGAKFNRIRKQSLNQHLYKHDEIGIGSENFCEIATFVGKFNATPVERSGKKAVNMQGKFQ